MRSTTQGSESVPRLHPESSGGLHLLLLYLGLSLMLTQVHAYIVNSDYEYTRRPDRHVEVLRGTGQAPYVYRILVPRLAQTVRPAFAAFGIHDGRRNLEWGYLFWRWVFTCGLLLLFHRWLERWLDPTWALAGGMLFTALQPASYLFYWFQPESVLDHLLWTAAALISLRTRGQWLLFPLVLLGAFNRETILFVPLIHFALRFGEERLSRLLLRCAGLVAVWAAVFVGLRMVIGMRELRSPPSEVMQQNMTPSWWLYLLCFYGILWLLPFLEWRLQPRVLRRLTFALIPYFLLQFVFGRIREVRLFVPLALVLIPMSFVYLRHRLKPGATGAE